jgi:hypothetical protein
VASLIEKLKRAGAVLAVVTTGQQARYWQEVTAATGGVAAVAGATAMPAFDRVAEAMRARYLLTFPSPDRLPARVSVRAGTAAGTLTAEVQVTAGAQGADGAPGAGEEDGLTGLIWLLVLGMVTLPALAGAAFLLARHARSRPALAAGYVPPDARPGDGPAPGPACQDATGVRVRIVSPVRLPARPARDTGEVAGKPDGSEAPAPRPDEDEVAGSTPPAAEDASAAAPGQDQARPTRDATRAAVAASFPELPPDFPYLPPEPADDGGDDDDKDDDEDRDGDGEAPSTEPRP